MRRVFTVSQRGIAVIGALLIALAATVSAAAMLERQGLLADTLASERDRAQADWVLRGGLDWARVILYSGGARNAVTRPDGIWAQPIVGLNVNDFAEGREALFSGRIEDEQGKYNLRQLVAEGEIVPEAVDALARLLNALDMPPALAMRVARRVRDSALNESGAAMMPGLRRLSDLSGLEDMDRERLRILGAYLTILPGVTPINVNTASAEVLSLALPGVPLPKAREVIVQRDRGVWFNNSADFFNRLGIKAGDASVQVAVNSNWFLVSGEVTLNQVVVGVQALLQRQAGQPPMVRWRVD